MSRTRYVVRFENDSPLLVGTAQALGNYRRSGEIVPGRTWRGALARVIQGEDPTLFEALFGVLPEDQASFGPLVLGTDELSRPNPPTLFACKYEGEDHGTFDTLIRQFAFETSAHPANGTLIPSQIDELRCPQCDAPAEPYQAISTAPQRVSTTHVGINRARRTAEPGILYVREGIHAQLGQYYYGWIDVPDALIEPFNTAFIDDRILRVGANRSRGMGLLRLKLFEPLSIEPLEARVKKFNLHLAGTLNRYRKQTGVDYESCAHAAQYRYFTIDLRSEAILRQDGLPARDPDLQGIGAVIERRWLEWRTLGGWHTAANLPRRSQLGVMGTYLCRFESDPDFETLALLEQEGIGVMREQGFGQITICDPIHNVSGL